VRPNAKAMTYEKRSNASKDKKDETLELEGHISILWDVVSQYEGCVIDAPWTTVWKPRRHIIPMTEGFPTTYPRPHDVQTGFPAWI
jgi:hypothetical protein